MGLIRKTFSISTFGVIPFRSKKERLRTAIRQRDGAAAALEAIEAQLADAKQRVSEAEGLALKNANRASRAQRRAAKDTSNRKKKRAAAREVAIHTIEEKAEDLSRRARKRLKKAQKRR